MSDESEYFESESSEGSGWAQGYGESESGESEYGESGSDYGTAYYGDSGAVEQGATVVPHTRWQYRFTCSSCDVVGTLRDTDDEAQSDGLTHELNYHNRVYGIEKVGAY